jgi:F-type H+-transporting ATPase subunit delta
MALDLVAIDNYAKALLTTSEKTERLDPVFESARDLSDYFEAVQAEDALLAARLRVFIESPQVPDGEKRALIRNVFGGRVDPLLLNLMCLMIDKRRADHIAPALCRFCEMADERKGIHPGLVRTARELTAEERERMQSCLERFTDSRLRLRYGVDPNLIGGVVFKYRDLLVDSTLRASLDEIRATLDGLRLRLEPPEVEA